ncbi:MAG: hypothetical protein CL848_04850 [Crocinitomicaceae bacterium]|nr:hypothetical protein [Crocinitomicaceae bacterium]
MPQAQVVLVRLHDASASALGKPNRVLVHQVALDRVAARVVVHARAHQAAACVVQHVVGRHAQALAREIGVDVRGLLVVPVVVVRERAVGVVLEGG